MATVLPTDTPERFEAAVRRAAELLRIGEVVALPTETVYGLAANALAAEAVARLFQVKGRPAHNPIIVHVASAEMARRCVSQWPALAERLARAFWPGPLTLVLPRAPEIPDVVTGGGPTVGVRWPSHPFIQAVIRACGFPLAAPSANLSTRVSPTTAGHVRRQLGERIPLIVDGGPSQVGIESTVLDVSVSPARLLRPGMIHEQALLAVTGQLARGAGPGSEVLKSPGLLRRHYSPRARLVVWAWRDEAELSARLREFLVRSPGFSRSSSPPPGAPAKAGTTNQKLVEAPELRVRRAKTCVIAHTRIPSREGWGRVSVISREAAGFARAIYGELHAADEAGAELIVVEALPETSEWRALADRLSRAAAV